MADIKISQLGAAASVGDSDVFPIVQDGVTVKGSIGQVKTHTIGNTDISGIGDGSVTGAISSLDVTRAKRADIATVETSTASKTYNEGDQFYLSGVLYEALTTIASGTAWSSLTLDTDYKEADNMTSQIQTLANSLSTETTNRQNADNCIWGNGSVNLAGPTEAVTQRRNGVLYTVNPDGSITASNDQATDYTTIIISYSIHLYPGTYKLVGGKDANNFLFMGYEDNSQWNPVVQTASQDAVTFTITSERSDYRLGIYIVNGETPNFEFRPMITRSDYPYCDRNHYVPFARTNKDITDILSDTGWVTFSNEIKYRVKNGFCTMQIDMNTITFDSNGNCVLAYDTNKPAIPSITRPSVQIQAPVVVYGYTGTLNYNKTQNWVVINPSGSVKITGGISNESAGQTHVCVTYPI